MSNYNEQLQKIAREYKQEQGVTTIIARDLAAWAISTGRWKAHQSMLVKQCADEFARALREEYIIDPQGRKVRSQHVAIKEKDGEQIPLWADLRTAPREHIAIAFQQRRRQIVGDCRQLKIDVDSYNENYNAGASIQMVFDFTMDLEEEELAKTF